MAALTKNAISVTVSDRAKQTKIWDHIQIVIRASFVFRLAKTFHDSCCIYTALFIVSIHAQAVNI